MLLIFGTIFSEFYDNKIFWQAGTWAKLKIHVTTVFNNYRISSCLSPSMKYNLITLHKWMPSQHCLTGHRFFYFPGKERNGPSYACVQFTTFSLKLVLASIFLGIVRWQSVSRATFCSTLQHWLQDFKIKVQKQDRIWVWLNDSGTTLHHFSLNIWSKFLCWLDNIVAIRCRTIASYILIN